VELTEVEQRVLGCLLEKERTVPAAYPLTLNALRTACNQTSSRDPVVEYDERLVEQTCRELKQRGLVRIVWADTGRRTLKYHQTLSELLSLPDDERALLTVLLLRGPQAAGELRTRTERLHAFADRGSVEACLARMSARDEPLVRELPRKAGDRDPRWVHLLGGRPGSGTDTGAAAEAAAAGPDLATRDDRVRSAYTTVAAEYAEQLVDELSVQPFERWLLGRVADLARGTPVVEVGCGPGHVTAHLADLGVDATGIDLAPGMVAEATRRFPQARYEVGDLRRLVRPPAADGWGAVLAWYAMVHLAESELADALSALVRPLRVGGWLVYAGHAGTGLRHRDEWFGQAVDLDFVLHRPEQVAGLFERGGLVDVEWYHRGPLSRRDETSERVYVLGRRAG
jgi:uncharacterized protein YceH (UPF0502 family)